MISWSLALQWHINSEFKLCCYKECIWSSSRKGHLLLMMWHFFQIKSQKERRPSIGEDWLHGTLHFELCPKRVCGLNTCCPAFSSIQNMQIVNTLTSITCYFVHSSSFPWLDNTLCTLCIQQYNAFFLNALVSDCYF